MLATADEHGIVLRTVPGAVKQLTTEPAFELSWSPDSTAIAYITGRVASDVAETGDLKVVTLRGRTRTVVRRDAPYGGQIFSLTWVRPVKGVRFRKPARTDGIFAGGLVNQLAADGGRVAYASCLNIFSWLPRSGGAGTQVAGDARCLGDLSRFAITDLAVAGGRVAWGYKTPGQAPYSWYLYSSTDGPPATLYTLAHGLGWPNPEDSLGGALVGAGDMLAYAVWSTTGAYPGGTTIETLYRATTAGCPCTAIAYAASPRSVAPLVPLDTDGQRIVLLRYGSLVIIDPFGNELRAIPVAAADAQLLGEDLVALVPGELRVYSLIDGNLIRSWPLPTTTVGRDCTHFSEPHCPTRAELRLQDAGHGLAAYTLAGAVHVVGLADGRDGVAAFGTEARFIDSGMVVADGARVRFIPYASLP
ncbi:MAG TPA: hypothetical protein VFU26_13880 [Gaiellaceae bacterium]|nr:hypothetical protein [Gaiellaceae bacterium]